MSRPLQTLDRPCALPGCTTDISDQAGLPWCTKHQPFNWNATYPNRDQWPLTGLCLVTCGDCGRQIGSVDTGKPTKDNLAANWQARHTLGAYIAGLTWHCACDRTERP